LKNKEVEIATMHKKRNVHATLKNVFRQHFSKIVIDDETLFSRRPKSNHLNEPSCLKIENLQAHFGKFFTTTELLDIVINRANQKSPELFIRRHDESQNDEAEANEVFCEADCLIYFGREVPEIWLRSYLTSFDISHHQKYPQFASETYVKIRDLFRNFRKEPRQNQVKIIEIIARFYLNKDTDDEWSTYLTQLKSLVKEYSDS
jgi:hypothetical protein